MSIVAGGGACLTSLNATNLQTLSVKNECGSADLDKLSGAQCRDSAVVQQTPQLLQGCFLAHHGSVPVYAPLQLDAVLHHLSYKSQFPSWTDHLLWRACAKTHPGCMIVHIAAVNEDLLHILVMA